VRTFLGVARSFRIYYGRPSHLRRMRAFYGAFLKRGDLVFDIGAHAGDRVHAFTRLGCRVVAVEPQPALFAALKLLYGWRRNVILVEAAISDSPGTVRLHVNSRNPTVTTGSLGFVEAARAGAVGWEGQVWDREIEVACTTLDALIARHGAPAFVKIDVEGFEHRVLEGLSQPLPALSFEFTTLQRDVALACLDRLSQLSQYRFNACLGESWRWEFKELQSAPQMADWLLRLPPEANSGDIYAFRAGE
jgi:FkbM family methyltransferase